MRSPPCDPHHFMQSDPGLARKPDDMYTVPLCRECHTHWHMKAYLPVHEYARITISGTEIENSAGAFAVAHAKSIALMYQREAQLMAAWIKDYVLDIPDEPMPDNGDVF
jgi:hypothetical protein